MKSAFALVALGVVRTLTAVPSADFTADCGKIRPELHSSGFGPTICSQTEQDLADVRAMGFKAARTHDWALVNSNERVCDYFHIFPLMHLDAKDPANYVFGPTDYLLKRTREEAGLDIFYRMGTSIEHSGDKVHFNSAIPQDFDKMAEIFAGTVRHYNRGWANGYKWGIKYWEIWNEPDGVNNMWCLPEGDEPWDVKTPEEIEKKALRRKLFAEFYVKVLKRLKGEFGDEIKVGGPALCSYRESYFRQLLQACRDAGVKPDFISWHAYVNDPMKIADDAAKARKLLDEYGFKDCETVVNEWHYFGYDDYGWSDMQKCSDPAVKARIWTGPRNHNGIHSACFTLATLANLQRSQVSQAYYYGCSHVGSWGFKDSLQAKFKVFYALKLFGDIVRDYETVCESGSEGTVTTFAVRAKDGKKALLVVDYGGTDRTLAVGVKGVQNGVRPKVKVLDYGHDLVPLADGGFDFSDGTLSIKKPDSFSAAFFVEF